MLGKTAIERRAQFPAEVEDEGRDLFLLSVVNGVSHHLRRRIAV